MAWPGLGTYPLLSDQNQPTNQPKSGLLQSKVFAKVANTTIVLGTPLPWQEERETHVRNVRSMKIR